MDTAIIDGKVTAGGAHCCVIAACSGAPTKRRAFTEYRRGAAATVAHPVFTESIG